MEDFLHTLETNLASSKAHNDGSCRCGAAVAVLLRQTEAGLSTLFIKRAANPRDRWSSHVAFPGGRRDTGETCFECCIREVEEEVGLRITPHTFRCLGKLSTFQAGSSLKVAPYVFLECSEEPQRLDLQESEVAAARWIPLEFFLFGDFQAHLQDRVWKHKASGTRWVFPLVSLPHYVDDDHDDQSVEYPLWGLTLSITRTVLSLGGDYEHVVKQLKPSFTGGPTSTRRRVVLGSAVAALAGLYFYSKL